MAKMRGLSDCEKYCYYCIIGPLTCAVWVGDTGLDCKVYNMCILLLVEKSFDTIVMVYCTIYFFLTKRSRLTLSFTQNCTCKVVFICCLFCAHFKRTHFFTNKGFDTPQRN